MFGRFGSGLALLLFGCSPAGMVNALVPSDGYQVTSDVSYGENLRQRLDVYVPERLGHPAPVVVFFYGGSWQSGDRRDYRFVAEALASQGFAVVIPDYRVYPEVIFPVFVEDGARVVRWAHDRISALGGDPRRIFLMGHSAGAHIAAMLALDEQFLRGVGLERRSVRGMIGLAGPYDFLPFRSATIRALFGPPQGWERTQPIRFVDGEAPPMLLITGDSDETVDPGNTSRLAASIREHGGSVEEIHYASVGHLRLVAALASPLRGLAPVRHDVAAFVRAHAGTEATR